MEKTQTICLDERYSTTRLVTTQKPVIGGKPGDKFETVLFLHGGEGRKGEGGLRTRGYFKRSLPQKPLITVITVIFNGEKYLEETIRSVINQTYSNVEYIIVDGGSRDGTLEIIKRYENQIDYWVSESDKSMYDAMNKGIIGAQGEIICILNSDDHYENYTIDSLVEVFAENSASIIYGSINKQIEIDRNLYEARQDPGNLDDLYKKMAILHQATFIKSNVYKDIGLYKPSFKIAGDWDLVLRAKKGNQMFFRIEKVLTNCRIGGVTTNIYDINIKSKYECLLISRSKGIAFWELMTTFVKYILFILMKKMYIRYRINKIMKNYSVQAGFLNEKP